MGGRLELVGDSLELVDDSLELVGDILHDGRIDKRVPPAARGSQEYLA